MEHGNELLEIDWANVSILASSLELELLDLYFHRVGPELNESI